MDRFKELTFRFSKKEDEEKIRILIETRFGNRKSFGAYEDIENRYYLAEEEDGTLVAVTGLIDSGVYCGPEVDWTCILEKYEHRGLITFMLDRLLRDVEQDVYCSCWRWRGGEINLKSAMGSLGFEPVLLNRTKYDSRYLNCRVICKAYHPIEGYCTCAEDLYVRRYGK